MKVVIDILSLFILYNINKQRMNGIVDFLFMMISCSCCEDDFIRHTQLENKFYEEYPKYPKYPKYEKRV